VFKLPSYAKLLTDYFSDPTTDTKTSETGFPYCVWKRYRGMATRFVAHFKKDLSNSVCDKEAEGLVNALLNAGKITIPFWEGHLLFSFSLFEKKRDL
jgi:hypothetical protein